MENTLDVVLVLLDMKAAGMANFIKTFGPMQPADCWNVVGQIMRQAAATSINATCTILQAVK